MHVAFCAQVRRYGLVHPRQRNYLVRVSLAPANNKCNTNPAASVAASASDSVGHCAARK